MDKSALEQAIELAGGSQAKLAEAVGCTQQAVSNWAIEGRVSRFFVLSVEAATGISRHVLRPDLYPQPVEHAA